MKNSLKLLLVTFVSAVWLLSLSTAQAADSKKSWTMPRGDSVTVLRYTPNGNFLMAGRASGILRRIDVSADNSDDWKGDEGDTLAHFGRINDIDFAPDNSCMATCSDDHDVKIWDNAPNFDHLRCKIATKTIPTGLCFSPDGAKLICSGTQGDLLIIDTKRGTILKHWNFFSTSYATRYLDNNTILLSQFNVSGDLLLISAADGSIIKAVNAHRYGVCDIAEGAARNLIVSAGQDGRLKLWSTDLHFIREIHAWSGAIDWIDISPDDKYIIAADASGAAREYDTLSGRMLDTERSSAACTTVSARPTGSYFAAGFANGVINIFTY